MNGKKHLVLTTTLTTMILLTPLFAIAQSDQPSLRYSNIDISFATCNRVVFSYYGDTKGNLRMVLFGPGWSWDNLCSMHDQWQVINDYAKTDGEYTLKCGSYCSFAQITWDMRAVVKENVVVLDMVATADSDSNLQAIVLEYSAPVDQFAKKEAYVMLSDGSKSKITFPETHVSGVSSLGSFENAVAWIIPMANSEGVVVAVLGENWPFGLQLYAQDEREWGNEFYSLRWTLASGYMFSGDPLRFLTVILPYNSTSKLDEACNNVLSLLDLLIEGASLDEVKTRIIEAPAATPTPTPTPTPTATPAPTSTPTPTPSPVSTELLVVIIIVIVIIIVVYYFVIRKPKPK